MYTAILIDGAFFLNRAKKIWGNLSPSELADTLLKYCYAHVRKSRASDDRNYQLYRIFYYDCPPSALQTTHPITGQHLLYNRTPEAKWRLAFFEELKKKRKVALRLGRMDHKNPTWMLKGQRLNQLLREKISLSDLTEHDIQLDIRQKGVDMRIGIDISSIAFKHQAQQIILIAGDSDFVPAAKAARREGIDFILDPLRLQIKDDLFEHIDGLRSMISPPDEQGHFDGAILDAHKRAVPKGRGLQKKKSQN